MRSLFAFFKKELMESLRGARVLGLGLIFIALGFMNPAITLMTDRKSTRLNSSHVT